MSATQPKKTITLSVMLESDVVIPSHIYLLSVDDNKKAGDVYGAWYVRWDILHYCDKDLKWQEYELDLDWTLDREAYKYPEVIDCVLESDSDESESENVT